MRFTITEMVTAMPRYLTKSWLVPGLMSSKYFISMRQLLKAKAQPESESATARPLWWPRSEAHGLVQAAVADEPLHDGARDHDAGEHGGEQPDDQGGGNPAHRPRTVGADDEARHQRGDVAVEDGPEDFFVAGADRGGDLLAGLHLLADALVDEHVRVHRQSQREHEAG